MRHLLLFASLLLFILQGCTDDGLKELTSIQMEFYSTLSAYNIYEGKLSDLKPSADYQPYQLGSTLFTDFAEKQRLVKLPPGTRMEKVDGGLPLFPDKTIIVKTFYYFHDKRYPAKGKRIIETRLLIKEEGKWNVADYLWDEDQSDAELIEDGLNTSVNFINDQGQAKVIAYHIPNNRECVTCHLKNDDIIPIGPKLRNLNIPIEQGNQSVNQLAYFQQINLMSDFDLSQISASPDYHNKNLPTDMRARAYLDINCGHCHSQDGFAADTDLLMNYEMSLEDSQIKENQRAIIDNLDNGKMPYLGTSILDEENIELIKEYLNSL